MKKKVAVAMSGGVDSSVAAVLLKQEGYDVIGLHMKLPITDNKGKLIDKSKDVVNVAKSIDIPLHIIDLEHKFKSNVIDYFCQEYKRGRTPNPCIMCNRIIKFGVLLEEAKKLGASLLATGHYARIEFDKQKKRYLLKKAPNTKKDQSYFLFLLSQYQLEHTLFPLTNYDKEEIRLIAKKNKLSVHDKTDSQEICFIPNNEYRDFLKKQLDVSSFESGNIVDSDNKVLGTHQGLPFYTIGQRKGIGAHKKKMYVTGIDKDNNRVIIGEDDKLYKKEFYAQNLNWIDRERLEAKIKVKAKIRYKHTEQDVTVEPSGENKVKVIFKTKERAITPGQAVVFYDKDTVLGGGWII